MNKKMTGRLCLILAVIFLFTSFIACGKGDDEQTINETTTEPIEEENALYVSADGSDENTGTKESPYKTIQKGIDMAEPGMTVYVREGVYKEFVVIKAFGSPDKNFILSGYPGENPVIDGEFELPDINLHQFTGMEGKASWEPLISIEGQYIVVKGIEVRNSRGRGIRIWNAKGNCLYNEVIECKVFNSINVGILGQDCGEFKIIDCIVGNTGLFWPRSGFKAGNWCAGLTTTRCHDVLFKGCEVYDTWGEGIGPYLSKNIIVEDCITYNNMSAGIYICNSSFITVRRNLVYETPDSDITWPNGGNMFGIGICDERAYNRPDLNGHDRTIVNNIVMGTAAGFFYWHNTEGSMLKNDIIANNTFVDGARQRGKEDGWGLELVGAEFHENTKIENNIIIQDKGGSHLKGVPHRDGLAFSNNCWSKPLADLKEEAIEAASSSGDYIGDPLITREGEYAAGKLTADYFKLMEKSPVIDKGIDNTSIVDVDFFGNKRTGLPDIGAIEFIKQ